MRRRDDGAAGRNGEAQSPQGLAPRPGCSGSGPEMWPRIVTRRPRATVRSRCSRAAPGIRPETLRSPATGSLTVEGLRPVRALRSDHPTWGLAAGCEERTRPETKSAAPGCRPDAADGAPPGVRILTDAPPRLTRADKPRRCASRCSVAPRSLEGKKESLRRTPRRQ
jgi:hypothetical protein